MKLFVYEFVTGGGTWHTPGTIDMTGPLLAEGAAMVQAVVADLSAAKVEVTTLLDARLTGAIDLPCHVERVADGDEESRAFNRLVREADATLLIAPEIGGILLDRSRQIESLGGKLISPNSQFVAIAADKQATAERLGGHGIPVPPGMRLGSTSDSIPSSLFPAVIKPCDGAGSWQVTRLETIEQLQRHLLAPELQCECRRGNFRIERFIPGVAGSVAVLCGRKGNVPLEPCEQILAAETFAYQGGRLPLAPPLAARAQRLALAAVSAMPQTVGYVGVDLVLGAARDGSDDYVIEINPRLTTSYVGLRAACQQNLAAAMLDVAAGRSVTVSFAQEPLEFRAGGKILAESHDDR